jgi:hypothetical protein
MLLTVGFWSPNNNHEIKVSYVLHRRRESSLDDARQMEIGHTDEVGGVFFPFFFPAS